VEELETRLAPSIDLLNNPAAVNTTPDVHVLHSGIGSPLGSPGLPGGFSPQQISQAYGFNQITFSNGTIKGDGSGQTIAIVDAYNQPNIASDLATFDSMYGIAAPPSFKVVNENGGSSLPTSDSTWGLEESLDVEWAHAMAPGANILLVEASSSGYGDQMAAVNYARNQPGVSVVSMSWGGSEWSGETSYDSYFTTPQGHNGVTFVASTGDNGSSGAPNYGSVSPNVVAVGGTQLSTDANGNYLGETGWNGSGGGISAYEKRPSYQPSTYINGTTTATSTMRMVPDVAYNGSGGSPYAIYDTSGWGGWLTVYGTSAGAPQWASMVAIADQGRALNGLGTLDGPTQTLPSLYKLSSDFHDIISGSNGAYSAGTGYDLVTGLGSPIANYLVPDLISGTAPTTPTGLTATAISYFQIHLSWNSVAAAHTYTIERSTDNATWQVVATTSGTTYTDNGLQGSTTYYYRIAANNGLGSSAYSASVNATTQATISGTASFVKTDTTTEGNWQGVYGSQGYNVIDNATSYPSSAQIGPAGNSSFVWNSSTTDPRALQDVGSSNRIAACWYGGTSSGQGFTVNVSLNDGQTHQLALYLLDWDQYGGGRSEQVQLVNAATGQVLDTENVSNFGNGEYLVWNVTGDVQIRITSTDSYGSAVLSGLFLDPTGSPPPPPAAAGKASFVKTDTTTEGSWQGVYGSQGYNVIDNASGYPSYAQISATGNSNWIWAGSTTDPRALQDVGSSSRIAACWYAGTSSGQGFTINVNLTDGQTHQLALYLLDWDQWGGGRSEQVQLVDANTGNVLSTQSVSNFGKGEYLVWNVSGDIQIRITSTDSFGSAVLSGLFLDPAATTSASFVKTDTTTQGNWQGVYGSQGYNVIGTSSSYPSYAQVSAAGNSNYVWNSSTTDPRALQDFGSSSRIAACWYAGTSSGQGFTINVNLTDGQTHQLALYLLDWDQWAGGRSEQVQILNASTGQVLDTESVSNFGKGEYLVWNVSGDIQIRITSTDSFGSAVLSGLFLDA
jgi:subtilase family serine protease